MKRKNVKVEVMEEKEVPEIITNLDSYMSEVDTILDKEELVEEYVEKFVPVEPEAKLKTKSSDMCPCGSGKKYRSCCMIFDQSKGKRR